MVLDADNRAHFFSALFSKIMSRDSSGQPTILEEVLMIPSRLVLSCWVRAPYHEVMENVSMLSMAALYKWVRVFLHTPNFFNLRRK